MARNMKRRAKESSSRQSLDPIHDILWKTKLKARQILRHVRRIARPRQRQNSNRARKSKNHLRNRRLHMRRDLLDRLMPQHLDIRGEQRKSLVDCAVIAAPGPHLAIPSKSRKAAVLHEARCFAVCPEHLLEMQQRDTLLTPSTRARPASRSRCIACQTSASASVHPYEEAGPCSTKLSTKFVFRCSSELTSDCSTCVAGGAAGS